MKKCPFCGKATENKYHCPYCLTEFNNSTDTDIIAELPETDIIPAEETKRDRRTKLEKAADILLFYNLFVIGYTILFLIIDFIFP